MAAMPTAQKRAPAGGEASGVTARPLKRRIVDTPAFDGPSNLRLVCSDDQVLFVNSNILTNDSEYWDSLLNGEWLEGQIKPKPSPTGPWSSGVKILDFKEVEFKEVAVDVESAVMREYLKWRGVGMVACPRDLDDSAKIKLYKGLYELGGLYLDPDLRALSQEGLMRHWTGPSLVTELFGDFVRIHDELLEPTLRLLPGHSQGIPGPGRISSIRSVPEVQKQISGLATGSPTELEDVQRAAWRGKVIARLLKLGAV